MIKFLLSLRQKHGEENCLRKILARENKLNITTRFLAVLGDLLVFHNRILKFVDLFCKTGSVKNLYDYQIDSNIQLINNEK